MTASFFDLNEETRSLLDYQINITQAKDNRWIASLATEHDFVMQGEQPPGQMNWMGDGIYEAKNQYDFIEPWDLKQRLSSDPVFRAEYVAAWAARPYFETAESARAMMRGWIFRCRQDMVHEAQKEAAQAYAYRAAKAAKAEK